jgi:hypothetical protein
MNHALSFGLGAIVLFAGALAVNASAGVWRMKRATRTTLWSRRANTNKRRQR